MWVVLFLMMLAALMVIMLSVLALYDRLPRNPWAGIRTSTTMKSDEAWKAAHRAAAPIVIVGLVPVFAAGLAFFPFSLAGRVDDTVTLLVVVAGVFVTILTVLGAAMVAQKAAQAAA